MGFEDSPSRLRFVFSELSFPTRDASRRDVTKLAFRVEWFFLALDEVIPAFLPYECHWESYQHLSQDDS